MIASTESFLVTYINRNVKWLRKSLNSNMLRIIYALLYGIYKLLWSEYF